MGEGPRREEMESGGGRRRLGCWWVRGRGAVVDVVGNGTLSVDIGD